MKVLLDTCVLSELHRSHGNPGVRRAVQALESEALFVSVLSIGEIVKGIALLSDSKRKRALLDWVSLLEQQYVDRILPIDLETSQIWGEITAKTQKMGRIVPACDGLIASSALRHGLHVMTRNTADFEPMGVMVVNPWE